MARAGTAVKVVAKTVTESAIQAANVKISKLIAEAAAKIKEAEHLADTVGTSFSFSVAYGMGGSYVGKHIPVEEEREESEEWEPSWESSDEDEEGWYPSSQSC